MVLLIDNYDSFTYNLWHFLADCGVEAETRRNDALSVADALALQPRAIVLSPGPCTPREAGICLDLTAAAAENDIPLFGVCLGFQTIGLAFGAELIAVSPPVHGKLSMITHDGKGVLAGCPNPFAATRYHSLALDRASLPDCLAITAETETGMVMGIEHKQKNIHGVLFHPESIATLSGHRILGNFLAKAGINTADEKRIAALETQSLDLRARFPDHVHV